MAATKPVDFRGYEFSVPAGWPVYRLGRGSTRCVRYDRSAVYLGPPGVNQQCPAHLVGQADTVSIAAAAAANMNMRGAGAGRPGVAGQPRASGGGLSVSVTYGTDPALVREVLHSIRGAGPGGPAMAPHSARGVAVPAATAVTPAPASRVKVTKPVLPVRMVAWKTGPLPGFDTCTAPSLQTMRAWRQKYSAAAVYIGGVEMACGYGNLSASWVRAVRAMGWSLIPIWVGVQAPCTGFSQKINPSYAAPEGAGAAREAVLHAKSFGIWRGAPVYFDMEAYNSSRTLCRHSVLSFLNAWTRQLHARGYASGVYSSAGSAAEDLGNASSVYGRPLAKPDSIWFALWDNRANLVGTPYLLSFWWNPDRRIKQYQGPHWHKVGRIRLNIDSDWVEGAVY
jgi:hypothetical protein